MNAARRRRPACADARRLVTGPFAGRLWCARKPYERIISEKSLCEAERCPFRSAGQEPEGAAK